MQFTFRLYFYWVSIFLIFYIGILAAIFVFWGLNMNFWQILLVFFIVGMIPPAIITGYFWKRLNYMESDNVSPPVFSGQKKATFKYKGQAKFPFDDILQRIDRQWIVSYSDRKNCILKFRTDARMTSWGFGGYIKMVDGENITVIIYPMFPKSKREKIMVNQIIRVMSTILNV
ncbi:MAG: hypothetical protein PHQ67_03780 [Fermentimonas sp.]|nr:hypothetical protein [Fermentimonas sp.]MDD4697049.1 hypothetical protein [Fermentimonas sp.]